jgi:curved DNA-binding protein CbpA
METYNSKKQFSKNQGGEMGKSLYEILEVEENASPGNIKNAYVRLKNQYEQSFPENDPKHISFIQYQAISEAHTVLSDQKRRDLYDQRLITERQHRYILETQGTGFPFLKVVFSVLLIAGAWMGYLHYRNVEAEKVRELHRIQLEQERVKLKQEELKLEAENARKEREELHAQQIDNYRREQIIRQARTESRQYAADVERMEEKERRRRLEEQRELARQEAERQRYDRMTPIGPTYIRR